MRKNKDWDGTLTVTRNIPVLTHDERNKRIEAFYNTLMRVNKVERYRGCKADSENNHIYAFFD